MLDILLLLLGLNLMMGCVVFYTNLRRAITSTNLVRPFGLSAQFRLSLNAWLGRLDWVGEHLTDQGLWHLDRAIRIRRLLAYGLAIYVVLMMAAIGTGPALHPTWLPRS